MLQLSLLMLGFVVLSGLMAIIEAAVLGVTASEVEVMVQSRKRGAEALRQIKASITQAVVVMVVFANTINVLGPVLVGARAVEMYGSSVIGIVTALLTLGTIVLS